MKTGCWLLMLAVVCIAVVFADYRTLRRRKPRNCQDAYNMGWRWGKNRVFRVFPGRGESRVKVVCQEKWTVIQRRTNGSVDFNRNWMDYREGFGDLAGEFWLGNEWIHLLTDDVRMELRIDFTDWKGRKWFAVFENFELADREEMYKVLSTGKHSGNTGHSFSRTAMMKFTTQDDDNDLWTSGNCATKHLSGWWFGDCSKSEPFLNLNGVYRQSAGEDGEPAGIRWFLSPKIKNWIKSTEMKLRPYYMH